MPEQKEKFTVIQKNLFISKGFQNYTSPPNMSLIVSSTVSLTFTYHHYAVTFPSLLRSPRLPTSAHTKELVIIRHHHDISPRGSWNYVHHIQHHHEVSPRVSWNYVNLIPYTCLTNQP